MRTRRYTRENRRVRAHTRIPRKIILDSRRDNATLLSTTISPPSSPRFDSPSSFAIAPPVGASPFRLPSALRASMTGSPGNPQGRDPDAYGAGVTNARPRATLFTPARIVDRTDTPFISEHVSPPPASPSLFLSPCCYGILILANTAFAHNCVARARSWNRHRYREFLIPTSPR